MTFHATTRPSKAPPREDDLPFTLADIRGAIPKHLFQFSWSKSCYYIGRDLVQLAVPVIAMTLLLPHIESGFIRALLWCLYAFVQGTTSFGLWVIGHECGHQSYFGHHHLVNDTVGYIIHTLYLAPYFSWKFTHATHHRYTNLKSKDTVFVPRSEPGLWWEIGEFFPPIHIVLITTYLVAGWAGHIICNFEGNPIHGFPTSHFSPYADMFRPAERFYVLLSDVGIFAMLAVLGACAYSWGAANVFLWYGGPVLCNYAWLVIVTFMQHTDSRVPHYGESDGWNFVKGALCTVDRDYGVFNRWMHHITNGHVLHHVFSTMPFYNAIEATPYVKARCGELYLTDDRPLWKQFWSSWWVHQSGHLTSKRVAK